MGVPGFALDAGAFLFTNARLACAEQKFALSGSGNSSVGPFSPGQQQCLVLTILRRFRGRTSHFKRFSRSLPAKKLANTHIFPLSICDIPLSHAGVRMTYSIFSYNNNIIVICYIMLKLLLGNDCLLYTSPSPRDQRGSRMPSSA